MIHYRLANFFSTLQFIVSGEIWNDTLQAGKFFEPYNSSLFKTRENLEWYILCMASNSCIGLGLTYNIQV